MSWFLSKEISLQGQASKRSRTFCKFCLYAEARKFADQMVKKRQNAILTDFRIKLDTISWQAKNVFW